MKYALKSTLFLLLIIFSISNVYSAICCYSAETGIYEIGLGCNADDIYLGESQATNTPDPTDARCGIYEKTRQGCFVDTDNNPSNGYEECYSTVLGQQIYQINEILNTIEYDKYCTDIGPITNECNTDRVVEIGPVDTNPGPGGSTDPIDTGNPDEGGNEGGGGPVVPPDDPVFTDTDTPEEVDSFCSDAGDPYGFFVTKNSCENIVTGTSNSCLYNPYLGGFFSAKFPDHNDKLLDYYENSCIPKSQINECFDYKTQENCETNPSLGISASNKLDNGCTWVPSSDYRADQNVDKVGICISTVPENDLVYFDKQNYAFRLNLLREPSFETLSGWQGTSADNYITDPLTYDGTKLYRLGNGDTLNQNVGGLANRVSYSIFLYARTYNTPAANDEVTITIRPFDSNGNLLSDKVFTSIRRVSDFVSQVEVGSFQRFEFDSFSSDSEMATLNFEIKSVGNDLDIDAIALESPTSSSAVIENQIFKPISIISAQASRCELCYDPLNLNLCTNDKSNIMGDCSYMVSDVDEEYGSELASYPTDENLFMNDPWVSQSIANARLFCNMYTTQGACEGNNFVNDKYSRLHTLSGGSLCGWDPAIGCFKDSDGNAQPDTNEGGLSLRAGNIPLEGEASSDFALACDSLPPNAYIYFTGTNVAGESVTLTNSDTDLVGNVMINIEASDAGGLQSCEGYGLDDKKRIYVDYEVTNDATARHGIIRSFTNQYSESLPIRDYFKGVDSSGNIIDLIGDGSNQIDVRVVDQSGNIGKSMSFNFNLDSQGPTINLVDPGLEEGSFVRLGTTLGQDATITFDISDNSGNVRTCTYELSTAPGASPPPSSYYSPASGVFVQDGEAVPGRSTRTAEGYYVLELPISNTSVNVDSYDILLTCVDVFGQEAQKLYTFDIDFYTQIVVLEPASFRGADREFGYMRGEQNFFGLSSERNLATCNLDFSGYDLSTDSSLLVSDLAEDYVPPTRYSGKTFFKQITGRIDFASDGKKIGKIVCEDDNGNTVEKGLIYYYDTVDPTSSGFELIPTVTSQVRVVQIDGNYYTYTQTPGIFNVSLDGTGTWIDHTKHKLRYGFEIFDTSVLEDSQSSDDLPPEPNDASEAELAVDPNSAAPPAPIITNQVDNSNPNSGGLPSNLDTNPNTGGEFVGGIANPITGFTPVPGPLRDDPDFTTHVMFVPPIDLANAPGAVVEGEIGLTEMGYNLEYFDRAGNSNQRLMSFFLDTSEPEIIVGGEDFNQYQDKIFANNPNPTFDVTFNAPSYRTYACQVDITDPTLGNFGNYRENFDTPTSNLVFDMTQVTADIVLTEDKVLDVKFECIDFHYGFTLTKEFKMYYDVTPPQLLDMRLEKGNAKYFQNRQNLVYGDVFDRVVFELGDTNEPDDIICSYEFTRISDVYDCDSTTTTSTFSSAGVQLTSQFNFLGGDDTPSGSAICLRNNQFDIDQQASVDSDNDLLTRVGLTGRCEDSAGHVVEASPLVIEVDYLFGSLASFDIEYSNGNAIPVVKSLVPFDRITISLDETASQSILDLASSGQDENGLFIYTSGSGIPLTSLSPGDITLYALALDSSDERQDYLTKTLFVDTNAPKVNLEIPDSVDGNAFRTEFFVLFDAMDEGSDLASVELYVNNVLIFTSDDESFYVESLTAPHDESVNFFPSLQEYDGRVWFNGSEVGRTYNFRFVATDIAGNVNETSESVFISDDFVITLLDSNNAFADPSRINWITSASAPTLNFQTSKIATYCEFYPMIDGEWVDVTGNSNIGSTRLPEAGDSSNRNTDFFSFDLSSIGSFDLSALSRTDILVRVLCEHEGNFIPADIGLRYVNYLPDYVLLSSEGFVFNEGPYTTNIEVRSVGPYRYVSCEYGIDGSNFVEMNGGPATSFAAALDFSTLAAGDHVINLRCEDVLGNMGPDKEYDFVINRDTGVDITDVKLSRGGKEYVEEEGVIYISSLDSFDLNFKVNKKNSVTCNYRINPAGNFLSGFLNFFRNLFDLGQKEMNSAQAFEFNAQNLNFEEGSNQLIVACNAIEGGEFDERILDVIYENDPIDIGLVRSGLS